MTDYSKITDDQLMDTLRAVVAEAPDKIYAAPEHMKTSNGTCFYVHTDTDGAPVECGCVVGQVLNRLGVPLEVLAEHEGNAADDVLGALSIGGDGEAWPALREAQWAQDSGRPWSDALASAERVYSA